MSFWASANSREKSDHGMARVADVVDRRRVERRQPRLQLLKSVIDETGDDAADQFVNDAHALQPRVK